MPRPLLLKAGLAPRTALTVVLAADTLSILTMEVADNAVMAVLPSAMNAGLVNVVFWLGMVVSLTVAFVAASPVTGSCCSGAKATPSPHAYHGAGTATTGWRGLIPTFGTGALPAAIAAFMLGGLLVAIADEL